MNGDEVNELQLLLAIWRNFAKKMLYPVNLWSKGISKQSLYAFMERDSWLPEDIAILQREELRKFMRYAGSQSAYYRQIFSENSIDAEAEDIFTELRKVPPISKQEIQKNIDSMIADDFRGRSRLVEKATGGSTGVPLKIYGDKIDYRTNGLVIARQRAWIGWYGGMHTKSFFGGFRDVPSRLNRMLKRWLINDETVNIMDIQNTDYGHWLQNLKNDPSEVIIGYFSFLKNLSRQAEQENTPLSGVKLIVAAAEPLEEENRKYVEKWLGAPVYFQYGNRELGTFAQECECQEGYHYAQDVAYCEVLDDKGKPAEYGQLTISYFGNRVVPLLRYQIGDGASLDESPCRCGLPWMRLSKIDGRISSMLKLPGGDEITSMIFPHLFKDYSWILEFQVEQPNLHEIFIRIHRDERKFSDIEEHQLKVKLRGLIGDEIRIRWIYDDDFLTVPTGKHIYFVQKT